MKYHFPLTFAAICLFAVGACSTLGDRSTARVAEDKSEGITTREQLLSTVNLWMRDHDQPEMTLSELLSRVAEESVTSSVLWKEVESPVKSFIMCLKSGQRFHYPIKLQTDWSNSIQLRYFKRRLSIPPHHTLSLHILATYADIWPSNEDPRKPIDLSMPIGTALTRREAGISSSNESDRDRGGKVRTPEQLIIAVNTWRRKARQPELTLNEIIARTADEIRFRHDLAEKLDPSAESFLTSLVSNRPFKLPTQLTSYGVDNIASSPHVERIRLSPHEAIYVEIANHQENDDMPGHPQFKIDWTRIILCYAFQDRRK